MKNLTASAQLKVATTLGTKPINIIGIKWTGQEILYADKELFVGNQIIAQGNILQLSEIDHTLNIDKNTTSAEVSVVLADPDGTLKSIMDAFDIQKVKCTVYQYFEGLTLSDAIVLFKGEINSPIQWSEGARTLSFNILSTLEEQEIGFSPEQSIIDFVDDEAIGNPWPLAFGNVRHIPAVKVWESAKGVMKEEAGYPDQTLYIKRQEVKDRLAYLNAEAAYWVAMSSFASNIAPRVQKTLDQYLALIIVEDNIGPFLLNLYHRIGFLQLAEEVAFTEFRKEKIRDKIDDLKLIRNQLGFANLQAIKDTVKDAIALIKFEQELRLEFRQKAVTLYEAAGELVGHLNEIENAIKEQESYIRQTVQISNGKNFPQNQPVEIVINDLRSRGVFNGDTFTATSLPLARYSNIALGPRLESRIDAFWITDSAKTLKDLFLWVTVNQVKTDEDGNQFTVQYPAVVKVADQVSTKVIIELPELSDTDDYETTILNANSNAPKRADISNYSKAVLLKYNANLPLTNAEFNTIRELEALRLRDKEGIFIPSLNIQPYERYEFIASEIIEIKEASPIIHSHWLNNLSPKQIEALPQLQMWFVDVGEEVRLADDLSVRYVANILSSDVKEVSAYKILGNKEQLVQLPQSYYDIESKTLGSMTVCVIKLKKPLSQYANEEWKDDIYVSLESSVGPNAVSVIEHLINTYTQGAYSVDVTSFTEVSAKINNYPANFAIFDQPNLIETLREIAWQSRCAIWVKEDKFYLKYLSEEPSSVATITESDIEANSLEIITTPSEDLVTKFVALWKPDYSFEEDVKYIVRHNIAKYGSIEDEYNFYIYNIADLVEKSATFWAIRYSNTWKFVRFTTFLQHLAIEPFDCITIDLAHPHISTLPVKAIVETATYDSENFSITIEAWVPVKTGSLVAYDLFWPSSVDASTEFPTEEEVIQGLAGSGPPNSNVSGNLGDIPSSGINVRPPDYGRQFNSDSLDNAPGNPLAGLAIREKEFPRKNMLSPKIKKMVLANKDPESKEPLKDEIKEVYLGQIISKVIDPDFPEIDYKYSVKTSEGHVLFAYLMEVRAKPLEEFTLVIIILNRRTGQFEIFDYNDYQWVREFEIVSVHDNYYLCKDLLLGQIKVAKAYSHRKSTFDDKTVGNYKYKWIDDDVRVALSGSQVSGETRINHIETLSTLKAGDRILAAQVSVLINAADEEEIEKLQDKLVELSEKLAELTEEVDDLKEEYEEFLNEAVEAALAAQDADEANAQSAEDAANAAHDKYIQKKDKYDDKLQKSKDKEQELKDLLESLDLIEWVDINNDGREWIAVKDYVGKTDSSFTTAKGVELFFRLIQFLDTVYMIKAGTEYLNAHILEDDIVHITLFESLDADDNPRYSAQVVKHFSKAKWISFKLSADDDFDNVHIIQAVDGYHPDPNNQGLAVTNELCYKGKSQDIGYARLGDDGSYYVDAISCCSLPE